MSKIPAINEIDANSPSQESTEVVVKATTVTPDINEIQETISASATIQEIDGTRKPTISEIYKIVNDGLFESTTNWWDYAYKLSQAQLNQDIISRLDNGVIGGGYSKGVDIITTTSNKVPSNTNVYSALKSDYLYPKKLNDEVINGIYDFLNGLTIGKPTAYTGGTWSVDQMGKTHLTTDYLYVRLKAIFETLQILNVDTIGGKLVISPAGSIRVAYVDKIKIDAPVFKHDENTDVWSISQVEDTEGNLVNETLNQEVYRCYFLGEQDGEEIDNKWKVGDQAQAKTFNVKKGTYHKVENSYLWRLVVNISSDTVDIDGKKYHYVDLSQIDFDSGSDAPAPGDVLNQLGHRLNDTQRQTALVLNAVDNYAPSITLYAGINYYTLLNKEYVEFGVYNGKAFFNVYGDMYIGDKGTNPKTYIKYKNGKINIKANLEIGSSIGDKDLDQYIKENGGVDEETVKNLINNSQVIKDLQKQTDGAIETWFYEGVPTLDNFPAVDWTTGDLKKKHIGDLYYDQTTGYAYRFTKYNDDVNPYRWNRIKDNDIVAALDAASRAQATADGKMKVFYGKTKPTNYQVGDMWVNATLEGKFNNDIARAVADNKTSFNANDWVLASRYSEAIATIQKWTNEYETKFSNLVDEVKRQKDQSIVVWYYDYEPTVDNAPANTWNTDELRSEHIGDIFYDIKNNHSYRWTGTTWIQIKDADFDKAMKAAKAADDKAGAAGDLADSKRRIFYSDTTPTEPFDKGDLWIKQVGDKTETWVYNGTDWVKSDDKALADFSNTINEELSGIKGQLDGKAETWYQVNDPSTDWKDKASHKGDIWYNTKDGTTNYWNGSAWEQMNIPKDVFDTIDGKSSIFVDSYADAKAGTGIICNGYKERDLWILPEDATVNGVKYYKGDMLTSVSKNTNFDETNWKKKVRYVGPTELNKAIDVVNEKINTINNITIPDINNKFNEFIEDGVLDSSEKARLTDLLNQASNEVAAVIDQVNNIITSKYLTNDNANKGKLEEANTVMNTAWTEYKNFIDTLVDANTEITKVNIGEANTKYNNLQEKIKAVKQYLAICQADILSGIGTDISSYKYLKEAFKGKTEVNGGLVVTNVLQLRQTSDASSPITAGISGLQGKANANGVVDKDTYDITSIAAWFGGPMVDKDIFTDEQLETKVPGTDYARSLFRHDGSGYLASGAIYWGTDGILHGNPNSFILQGTSIATIFYYIRLFYLHTANPDNTDFNNIDYVTPMKTFSRLSVLPLGGIEGGNKLPTGLFIGDSTTGGSFQIGNIILRTKSGDPNILEIVSADSKKTAHLGVQGGVSAYGTYTPSTGGGGGLNASIKSYANIIAGNYTDSDLTTIPNAYSIKALYNAIQNIDVTGQLGNYLLKSDAASTYQPKGNYLTTHQSIYGLTIQKNGTNIGTYTPNSKSATINISVPTKVSQLTNDSGYTTNTGTVTSVGISVPTGLSVTSSPITTKGVINIAFAEGYSIPTIVKQTNWDGAVNAKHTHTNKTVLDNISSSKVANWDNVYNWYVLMTTDEETTDGIINKWNEVVDFLSNISQTNTLSGIIDGINKSITDETARAKKAETTNATNITNNKTNITTLQSYFSNASAKKALQLTNSRKLWGNSFNGLSDINGSIILPTESYISIGDIKIVYDATNKALKINGNVYSTGGISAYGASDTTGSGGGLNGTIIPYSTAITSDPQNEGTKIASASSIYKLHSRISSIESNGATNISVSGSGNAITSVSKNGNSIAFTKGATFLTSHQSLANCVQTITTTGSGNAVTAISKSGSTITVTKGATFLTSHQSLANYYTKSSVDSLLSGKSATSHTHSVKINGVTKTIAASGGTAVDLGTYLTAHQSLANYVTIHDSRLTDSRYPKFANNTWYLVGDDVYIGDHNIGGTFCIKSANNDSVAGIALYNTTENKYARLWFDNKNINLDHQLVMNNNRIWIQGVGTAGGNNNRLTIVAGMPSGLAYNTSCRGTILYSNGIAFADPYNGNSNSDSGWIRHLETSANSGTLEIAVGDDASNEQIHFRWYNTNSSAETIAHDITVPRATGTLALTSQIPTTLPANGGNSDTVDGYHASGLLTALSNSDKGISITVGGTTKSVSNISVNYASSAGNADTVDGIHAAKFPYINNSGIWRVYGNSDANALADNTTGLSAWAFGEGRKYSNSYLGILKPSKDTCGINAYGTIAVFGQGDTHMGIAVDYSFANFQVFGGNSDKIVWRKKVAFTDSNVASASKLYTARSIWGQSFDGTGNVDGTLTITNSGSDDPHIISTVSKWFHIVSKYKLVLYAGEYNSSQNDAINILSNHNVGIGVDPSYKLHVAGNIYASDTIISESNKIGLTIRGPLNSTWSSWFAHETSGNESLVIATQNEATAIMLTNGESYGNISSDRYKSMTPALTIERNQVMINRPYSSSGCGYNFYVNGTSNFNGVVKVNNMLTAKGIMFTTADVNAFGTDINNWDGSIGANVTNMFNGIECNNISLEYSANGGSSWTTYTANPNYLFNLINDNSDTTNFYLGNNVMSGSSDADKLTQIKKNQLRVTIKIPPEVYQELAWISVDVNNGVRIKCQVYFGNSSGVYAECVSKVLVGWSHRCDICVGPLNVNVGNDTYRYVRLVFSHLSNHNALRNGIINRIRALALTKYNNPSGRYNISTTGHIYNYDYNMNTYFPNSILAKGGVTAYQSSDVRLKTNITKLNCLKVIKSIGGTYEFDYIRDHKHSIGFIAQNVNNPLLKDIIAKDDNGYLKINYWNPKLISLAFGALTEIDDEVDKLKARVRELENEVEYLKNKAYALQ